MSWGTCYSGSNNIHFNYPPIMSDSRNFSSWQPEAVVNKRIQQQENIHTSWQYRQFLINNGREIMKYNTMEACSDMGLPSHIQTGNTPSSNVPHLYKSSYDTNNPGYGYCSSNLKNPYLTREQLQGRLISPSIDLSEIEKMQTTTQ